MGGGCGPNLEAELSESKYFVASTTLTCPDSNQYALFGGGTNNFTKYNDVDIFDGGNNLERTIKNLKSSRTDLLATSIQCNDIGYALFAGGIDIGFSNDVDVFVCNDSGVFPYTPSEVLALKEARSWRSNSATSIQCNDIGYALFAGGINTTLSPSNDVDVFVCNDSGVFTYVPNEIIELSDKKDQLAATNIHCNDHGYALFAGGRGLVNVFNDVDVFVCNDSGLFPYTPPEELELSIARFSLAATNIHCNDQGYALFAGGDDAVNVVNDVDVFVCNDSGVFPYTPPEELELSVARFNLAATNVTAPDGKKYALFGGGRNRTDYSNVVDIFHCNDNGVFFTKSTTFNKGPGRQLLTATTVNCGGVDYALFAGGQSFDEPIINIYNDIDIFDSSTLEFL